MWTRRQALRTLGAAGVAVPLLSACGDGRRGSDTYDGGRSPGLRLVSADVVRSAGDDSAIAGVVDAFGAFTDDLWSVVGTGAANLALSPYSIATALAMTTNGAGGETADAMREVLHIDSLATYNAGLAALTQQLAGLAGPVEVAGKTQPVVLAPADQLFGDASVTWRRAFLTVLAKMYGAGMRTVDFRHDPEGARSLINAWASTRTHDRIPHLLPPGSLDDLTRLVLVNALYFKAPWATAFEKAATSSGRFTRADGTAVTVPMMTSGESAAYVTGPHFVGARLAYGGGRLAMTVALPTPGSEQAALRELLAGGLTTSPQPGLRLTMPRWTYRVATELKGPLSSLGMGIAFGDEADFSAMTEDAQLEISDIYHQTFVAVDEAGTEAAAATAVVVEQSSAEVGRHVLVLDRPFLFVIHDTTHGTPLFVGRVADPSSSA